MSVPALRDVPVLSIQDLQAWNLRDTDRARILTDFVCRDVVAHYPGEHGPVELPEDVLAARAAALEAAYLAIAAIALSDTPRGSLQRAAALVRDRVESVRGGA